MSENRYATGKQLAFIARLAREQGVEINTGGMSLEQASKTIEQLLSNRNDITQIGMYRNSEGVIFKVQKSQNSGRLYAKRLNDSGRGFTYEAGAIYTLKHSDKMTLEQVMEFGVLTGNCCVCGAELTDPVSVARGIGPICLEKGGERGYFA